MKYFFIALLIYSVSALPAISNFNIHISDNRPEPYASTSAKCKAGYDIAVNVLAQSGCNANNPIFSEGNFENIHDSVIVEQYCTVGCAVNITRAVAIVLVSCIDDIELIRADKSDNGWPLIQNLIMISKLPCVKHLGKYCFPEVKAPLDALASANYNPDAQFNYDNLCSPCLKKLHIASAIYKLDEMRLAFSHVENYCIKVGETRCYLYVKDHGHVLESPNAWDNVTAMAHTLHTACHPCVRKFISKIVQYKMANGTDVSDLKPLMNMLSYGCARDGKERCLPKTYQHLETALTQVNTNCNFEGNSCSAACKNIWLNLFKNHGCCVHQMIAFAVLGDNPNSNAFQVTATMIHVRRFVKETCDVKEFPLTCVAHNLKIKLILTNVIKAEVEKKKAQIMKKLTQELAAMLGIQPQNIEQKGELRNVEDANVQVKPDNSGIGPQSLSESGLEIDLSLIPDSPDQLAALPIEIVALLTNNIQLPETMNLLNDALENPELPVEIAAACVGTEEQCADDSAAILPTFSFGVTLILLFVLVFFF